VKQVTSLEFVLSNDVLCDKNIIDESLKYIKSDNYVKSTNQEVSILDHLILKLSSYMKYIGLVKTFSVINTYLGLKKIEKGDNKDGNFMFF